MISTYLEAQCHVIALLGYRPDEIGISMYAQHMQKAMAMLLPEDQERLRVAIKVREKCGVSYEATNDDPEVQQIELARKHTVVQEVMVSNVYLSSSGERDDGGAPTSLVEECGFGGGRRGMSGCSVPSRSTRTIHSSRSSSTWDRQY